VGLTNAANITNVGANAKDPLIEGHG